MPIIKQVKADNGVTLGYHRVRAIEIDAVAGVISVRVQSYREEADAIAKLPVAWEWNLVPSAEAMGAPAMILAIEKALADVTGSPFIGGGIVVDAADELSSIKARKRAEINAWWLVANNGYFEFGGKRIAYTESDRVDIQGINNVVALTGAMPTNPDWPAAWKAIDNEWVPLPDIEAWIAFNVAIAERGTAHFKHAQELKAQLDLATTAAEIESITW